jgi:hypothetical protein
MISSWCGAAGEELGKLTRDDQDTRAVFADDTTSCNMSLGFDSLNVLQAAASGFHSYCLDMYTLPLLSDRLSSILVNHNNMNAGYDGHPTGGLQWFLQCPFERLRYLAGLG